MKKRHYIRPMILVVALLFSFILPNSADAATITSGDLLNVTKTADVNKLVENDIANVSLTVKGTPKDSTFVRPNDVILIVDKSGSMSSDNRLTAAKNATKEFIDLMDLTKHRVGIVDFDDSVSSFPLTTDATAAKAYVDTIQLGGSTNTGDAVRTATAMLANHRTEAQPTIVILTDGAANNATDALNSATAAKMEDINFYSIALLGVNEDPSKSAPNELLKNMASSASHHHFVLGSVGLPDVYKRIAEEIGLASAYNVKITDTVSSEFEIVPGSYDNNIPKPKVNGNTLEWDIPELKSDELTFTYQIRAKTSTTAGKYSLGKTTTTFEDHQSTTYSLDNLNPIIEVLNPKPIISTINPEKGLTTGGETVSITGKNFLPGAKVYFGSNQATVVSETANEIVVSTPVGAQGTVEVKVVNTDGQFALGTFQYYADPTITSVTPAEGEMIGGNRITIIGSNYMSGAKVYINGVEAATQFSTASKLYVVVPASQIDGTVAVKVVNPDHTEAELANAYTYLTPPPPPVIQLDSLSANSGILTGGESIYLFGANFDRNVKVYFGDKEAIVNYYANTSKIRVSVPEGVSEGLVTVKAENPDGTFAELVNAYEYLAPPPAPAPEISYLSDPSALTGEQKTIYLFGKNILPGAQVFLGDEEIFMDFVTNSKVRIKIPISNQAKTVDVKLVNPDGQTAILVGGFTYTEPVLDPSPVITSLSSNTGFVTGYELITITGSNFTKGLKVYFGDNPAIIVSVTDTEIQVKTPASVTTGLVSVKVVNPDQQEFILTNGFEYTQVPITVTKLSVTSGPVKGGNFVVIYGTDFDKAMTVTVDGQEVSYTFLATNRIRISMPAAPAAGTVDITVDKAGAKASIQYTYN
ncbi:IPT/TIG domain-containing protein [Ferdinandcohnia quinoae]|uniref:IPT/TIG domain-containing protein n=1 Tax=Fredinandcohnia quinoae TaxID=2918902 RepID=A0AAW5DWP5_9BACI|nr:IPT/TIG domain-containing protein [Fredinandcohnia sp. SECRCQ15]MCH1625067.1 IPT/TIG domain-containing protein [Fredinandcohnia sp. SECRCQ15]